MTGIHNVHIIRNGKETRKVWRIEAADIPLNVEFLRWLHNMLHGNKPGDKIIIETELEE